MLTSKALQEFLLDAVHKSLRSDGLISMCIQDV